MRVFRPAGTSISSCNAGAEPRLKRWLDKYQRDRAAHEHARRSRSDSTTLDADFAQVLREMTLSQCHSHLMGLRIATDKLLNGARATIDHFQDESNSNLGGIVDLL